MMNDTVKTITNLKWQLATRPGLSQQLQAFEPIRLNQIERAALLNRTDTKFILGESGLESVLANLPADYWLLEMETGRIHRYQTLYFDTPTFDLYLEHHAGKRNRHKVRSRRYLSNNLSFLEVKAKQGYNQTVKNRVQTVEMVTQLTPQTDRALAEYLPAGDLPLEPKLWNTFSRLTLVHKNYQERLTIDLNLQFFNDQAIVPLPGLVIAELKQAGQNRQSPFMIAMQTLGIRPAGFSKYCIGAALLYPQLKHNNFKPRLQQMWQMVAIPFRRNHV